MKFIDKLREEFDNSGSDKIYNHDYHIGYAHFLKNFKPKTLLEIGIQNDNLADGQSSLNAWKKIFPECRVIGIDNVRHKVDVAIANGHEAYVVDQSNIVSLNDFINNLDIKEFDIIIDDASHIFNYSRCSFEFLFPYLSKRGVFLIEDILKDRSNIPWNCSPMDQSIDQWELYLSNSDIDYEIFDCRPETLDNSLILKCMRNNNV